MRSMVDGVVPERIGRVKRGEDFLPPYAGNTTTFVLTGVRA